MNNYISYLIVAVGVIATFGLLVLSGVLLRSNAIRLGHWAQNSGEKLKGLYDSERYFESFRLLLSVLAYLFVLVLGALILQAGGSFWVAGALCLVVVIGGELLSSHWVLLRAEETLDSLTAYYRILAFGLTPLIRIFGTGFPNTDQEADEDEASDEEIDAFIEVGRIEGLLEKEEEGLLRGLMEFVETQVKSVMTPRIEVVGLKDSMDLRSALGVFIDSGHSRLPVFKSSVDDVVGIVHIRDVTRDLYNKKESTLDSLSRPAHFVPDTKSLVDLLSDFQQLHQELAIVVDEYGGTEGIVTLEDLLEEIVGDIVDEHDDFSEDISELENEVWMVNGTTAVDDLEELFDLKLPDSPYNTVSGLILAELGDVPRQGKEVEAHGLHFRVEGSDDRTAKRVRVSRSITPTEESE